MPARARSRFELSLYTELRQVEAGTERMSPKDVAATLGVAKKTALDIMRDAGIEAETFQSTGKTYRYGTVSRDQVRLVLAHWIGTEEGARRFARMARLSLALDRTISSDEVLGDT